MHTSIDELTAWLILHLAHCGHRPWRKGLALFSSARTICQLPSNELQRLGVREPVQAAIHAPDWATIERALAWQQHPNHHILTWNDPGYPPLLRQLSDAPALLYVIGNPALLLAPQLAVVGSRQPTATGSRLAQRFAAELASAGLTITSGLAMGIDAISHKAAIHFPTSTVAVLGTGVDVVYPLQHQSICAKIADHGAIISEFQLSTPARSMHFPQRNRLISGLSLGTLVVEATLRSGSLITARLALEQGRDVFAVPSSPTNPMAAGCHWLIQQGAKLVTCVNDILEECRLPLQQAPTVTAAPSAPLDMEQQKLLECIGYDAVKFEQLVGATGFTEQKISVLLCNLLLNGYIKEALGGYLRAT